MIAQAKQKLRQLEQQMPSKATASTPTPTSEQPLQASLPQQQLDLLTPEHPVLAQLRQLQPDELSARQALDLLYQLKQQLDA